MSTIIHPHQWLHILELESERAQNPSNVETVIVLAQAYREVGSDGHGHANNIHLVERSENAVLDALSLLPNSPDLHAEMARIYLWQSHVYLDMHYSEIPNDPSLDKAIEELSIAMQLDPDNKRVQALINELTVPFGHLILRRLPSLSIDSTESPTPTVPIQIPTATNVPELPTSAMPGQTPNETNSPEDSDGNDDIVLYISLLALFLIAGAFILLLLRWKRKSA